VSQYLFQLCVGHSFANCTLGAFEIETERITTGLDLDVDLLRGADEVAVLMTANNVGFGGGERAGGSGLRERASNGCETGGKSQNDQSQDWCRFIFCRIKVRDMTLKLNFCSTAEQLCSETCEPTALRTVLWVHSFSVSGHVSQRKEATIFHQR
jgi:hypothetical protein